jgi:iron complex transport system ATP-binding protein
MILSASHLVFGYPRRTVGRDLTLALGAGEVLCVLGPNGAGKTTLLRTLLGLIPARGGEVRLGERRLGELARAEVARTVAYVPQSTTMPFDFTVLEMVEMARTAHLGVLARPGRHDREVARAALERLGIAHLAQRAIGAVSGGERQLALIARALATQARAMVMDEPTASLDLGNQSRVLDEILRLRAAGIGILLCSHDPDHALRVADRALLLAKGQTIAQGSAAEILVAENLSKLYGVTVYVTEVETPAGRRRVCVPALAA